MCLLFACNQNNEGSIGGDSRNQETADPLLLELKDIDSFKDSYVVVLLGYGYNEGVSKDTLLAQLDEEYGLAENGGIIIPFVFPDDFISFGYERISLLPENISEVIADFNNGLDLSNVSALLTLGAPDGTHVALAALQDAGYDMQVFSVFSQDDVLGAEAGSTLVIDYSISQSEQQEDYELLGEIDLSYPGDVFSVLSPLINVGLNWDNVKETGLLIPALRTEYAKKTNCDFFVYVDPQTGLRAENHYVLTQKG